MKQLFFAAILCTVAASCSHKAPGDTMTIVRDCTGSYLRFEGKDYHVCNLSSTNPFADGANVKARFKRIPVCHETDAQGICLMAHENEGWIEVVSIR